MLGILKKELENEETVAKELIAVVVWPWTALQWYARARARRLARNENETLKNLRFMRKQLLKDEVDLSDPNESAAAAKAVVVDGILARQGLLPVHVRQQLGDKDTAKYLDWVIALAEQRGLETAFRYLWPVHMQPKRWRRRTARGGQRSWWERLLDTLGEKED